MALLHKPVDGYDPIEAARVGRAVHGHYQEYVSDCRESDTKPDIVDFLVWAMQMDAFKSGVAFARDDTDEPGSGSTSG
jgi:hypothetical protein